jgi:Bacterial Ig-like domain (group 3)/FG-GAP-like repeat
MNRFAPLCTLLLAILPSFAATNVQKIAPQNRFQFSPPASWTKAETHGKSQTALPGGGKAKQARLAAKNAKAPSAPDQPCAQRFHPGIPNLPVGKLGFLSAQQIPVGGGIYNSGVSLGGDFNGDGKEDLVSQVETNRNSCPSYWISVVLSNGDGTFQAPVLTAIPDNNSCSQIAVGDLNGDGKDDLLVVHQSACSGGTSSIDVLIGNGDGTFTLGNNYPITDTNLPGGVLVDVSGDSKLDIVVIDQAIPANVWTLLGNGDGTFQTPTSVALSGQSGNGAVFTDLNGDGLLDLADMAGSTNQLTVYLATSASTYANGVSYDTSDTTHDACSLTAGDLTGDGKAEIVNANCNDNTLTVYVNNGDGTFQTGVYYADGLSAPGGTTADLYPEAVAIADVNGDGKADIISLNDNSADVTILLGNGDGTVNVPSIGYAVGGFPQLSAIVGDFNGDGNVDLVVPDLEYSLVFLKGYGDGTFHAALDYFSPIASDNPDGVTVATGDFNGDGNPDFVLGNCCGTLAGITVFLSRADGSLLPGVNYTSASGSQQLQYVTVADFNKDGKLDIAAADSDNGAVQIFNGVGDGTFTVGASLASGAYEDVPTAIISGDFNHDGFPDLAVANINDGTQDVAVMLNDGTGNFLANVTYPLSYSFNDIGLAAIDLNNDGNLDLVVPLSSGSVVAILLGNSDGTFQPEADLSIPSSAPVGAAVGDFNGDGIPDLAVTLAQDGTNGVAVALGVGDGTFGPPVIYLSTLQDQTYDTPQPTYIQTADIDGDGKLDLIYTNSNYATVGILFGIGDGTFYAPVEFPAGGYAYGLALADVNHDGTLDVVTANDDYSGVTVLFDLNGTGTQSVYTVTTSTPTATVTAGGSAVYNLTLTPANHYNGLVTMSCGALPAFTTCSFNPASFQMDGHTPVAVQLTVSTTAAPASGREPVHPESSRASSSRVSSGEVPPNQTSSSRVSPMMLSLFGGIGLVGIVLGCGRKRATQLPALLLAFVVLPSLLFMGACGKDCDDYKNECAVAAVTTTTATSSLNPANTAQAVTFTGTVASSGATPTGTITFLDGTTQLGTGTLSSGAATFKTSSLTAGTHSITVSYAGDSSFKASVSAVLTETVNAGAATTATVTSSLNPATTGQAVTFTGTIASSGGTPTGTVTFLDGTTTLGTGTLSAGVATFQTSSLTAGTHSITASYAGATGFAASTSAALTETVTSGGTPAGTYTIPINAVGTAGTNNGNTGTQSLSVTLVVQ